MARGDEELKCGVVDELHWDSRTDASRITVTVNDGVVTLAGEVPSYAERSAAVDAAWAVADVREVINEIAVRHTGTSELPSDVEVEERIMTLLEWNPRIDQADINLRAVEGEVSLEGSVDTHWKRLYVEDVVANVRGVVTIHNNLSVVPTRSVTDQMIADDIVSALRRNLLVDVDKVEVNVANGVVTLSGQVMSQAERRAAEDDASLTRGVVSVRNNLSISRAAA